MRGERTASELDAALWVGKGWLAVTIGWPEVVPGNRGVLNVQGDAQGRKDLHAGNAKALGKVTGMTEHASASERSYGAAAHVAPLVWGNVVPVFGSFAVTLLVWWWMRESAFVVRHARASINFQLSMTLHYALAFGYLFVSLSFGVALLAAAAVFEAVSALRAAKRAKAGQYYRNRLCLQIVKDEAGK